MKSSLFLYLFFGYNLLSHAQNVDLSPSANTLMSIRLIQYKTQMGTSFIVNYKKHQYLISVKHLFENKSNGDTVHFKLSEKTSLLDFNYRIYFHKNDSIDIAVIKVPDNFLENAFLSIDSTNSFSLGQRCYFLGYPLGLGTTFDGTYLPLYKSAIFSGIPNSSLGIFVFDAHNNQGFSGAPIFSTNSRFKNQFLVGIVYGYAFEQQINKISNRDTVTSLIYRDNSGIMLAHKIGLVNEIIEQNKISK